MEVVTISHGFRIVIPPAARDQLGLSPGQQMQTLVYDGRIELIPIRPSAELRGFLKGIDTSVGRDPERG